jgi:hypothetical protein
MSKERGRVTFQVEDCILAGKSWEKVTLPLFFRFLTLSNLIYQMEVPLLN